MHPQFEEDLDPSKLAKVLLYNLEEFNDKPDLLLALFKKQEEIEINFYASVSYYGEFQSAKKFFEAHDKFPSHSLIETKRRSDLSVPPTENFSMDIYYDYMFYLNTIIYKTKVNKLMENPTTENLQKVSELAASFPKNNKKEIKIVAPKDYASHIEDSNTILTGVRTGIKQLDDHIKFMARRGITTIAFPSGQGKTSCAVYISYNAAIFQGLCVDYLCLEEKDVQIESKLISLESYYSKYNLKSGDIIEQDLTEEQKLEFKQCSKNMQAKMEKSGGDIRILDKETLDVDTFEELILKLERLAEERERPADLIVIDNVNCFSSFRGSIKGVNTAEKVNEYILKLDTFSQSYLKNRGTSVLMLAQVNREGLTKLGENNAKSEDGSKKKRRLIIDTTVLAEYNNIERKSSIVLVGYADPSMVLAGNMMATLVKNRSRGGLAEPLQIPIIYDYCVVGGNERISPIVDPEVPGIDVARSMADQNLENIDNIIEE